MLSQHLDYASQAAIPSNVQRSLRHCLSSAAEMLYDQGYVLESITLAQRGLAERELDALRTQAPEWAACQDTLEISNAATFNAYGRFVLTPMGRELMFDMFGQGAADCA
ncbi:hypothetical protein [Vreelandella nanhaiensis]|uniref:Uncharacterized protein n=1 Tax=Vreelandella nanhaiensis TaxID=1258546 RepID=A0A433KTY0_9GAMM|nr:hypothetical protein [Halomonas nanhaiensis]RUR33027.1 hypothetical protein ELY38_05605 [Halomonas nanhaiensis]